MLDIGDNGKNHIYLIEKTRMDNFYSDFAEYCIF